MPLPRISRKAAALQLKGVTGCIADGASCSENAQLASETSVTHFISDYYSTPDTWPVKTAAARVLSALNSWLYHHGKQSSLAHNGSGDDVQRRHYQIDFRAYFSRRR